MPTLYSADHQWIDVDVDDAAAPCRVGISPHAQQTLGDVVFVELPAIGARFRQGEVAAVVESVKTAADVMMPVGGEVVAVNQALRDDPALANTDPLGAGWFFSVRIADAAELGRLLDAAAYAKITDGA